MLVGSSLYSIAVKKYVNSISTPALGREKESVICLDLIEHMDELAVLGSIAINHCHWGSSSAETTMLLTSH